MIRINYDKPTKQQITQMSAYLSFPYNPVELEVVRSLTCRYWIPETKQWEIPTNILPELFKKIGNDYKEMNELVEESQTYDDLVFKTEPLSHQVEGVQYGLGKNGWVLGDEQGLGKTKQMIDLGINIARLKEQGLKHCLVICGINSLKENWVSEIKKHSNETVRVLGKVWMPRARRWADGSTENRYEDLCRIPDEFFWVTNIETLRCTKENGRYKSKFVDKINELIKKGELGFIVVDEIHKCKNPTSAQGRGLLKIESTTKVALSGTIMVNNPLDLYTPLAFIGMLKQSFFQFKREYVIQDFWGGVTGFQNMDKLQSLLQTVMLRRRKADRLDLPPKLHKQEYLELSGKERQLYDEILSGVKNECDKIKTPTEILAKLVRLRQVCCHTSLVSEKVKESTKFDRLRDILEEAKINNQKVIVFSMFRELIELALEDFKDFKTYSIVGGMKSDALQNEVDSFQEEKESAVIFGTIGAMGTGLTLNTAEIVVFLDLPWNMATMEQAEDRAHRIGTKNTIQVITLLGKGTYDELLYKLVISKGAMSDVLVDNKDAKLYNNLIKVLFEGGEYVYEE